MSFDLTKASRLSFSLDTRLTPVACLSQQRRFGYRRLHVLLRREGQLVNKKRVQRLYREERLTVRRPSPQL